KKGEVPRPGYSQEKISYVIVIDGEGNYVDTQSLLEQVKKKLLPSLRVVPQPIKKTSGIAANLLWDKTAYALGATGQPSKRAEKKGLSPGEEEFEAFRTRQYEAIGATDDPGLKAFLAFLDKWNPADYSTLRHAEDMLDSNVVFRLDGPGEPFLHDRPAAEAVVRRSLGAADATEGICLVTGETAPIARLHPSIKGVRGAQSSGASIVSFNQTAFASYGKEKEQGLNAPVSEHVTFAYTTALNALLRSDRNRVQIGDASVVFWAEPPEGADAAAETAADEAEDLMATMFSGSDGTADGPGPDDKAVEADLLARLEAVAEGRPRPDLTIDPAMPFYVLGLSPNAARISVRFWLETTVGDLARRLGQHYEDLRLEPLPWRKPPHFWRLLIELAPQHKSENIPTHLAGELTRAILTGTRYPLPLLTLTLSRLRADHEVTGLRAALIKATLTRLDKEVPVSLSRDELDPGYRLGRLFAVLEAVQRAGVGDVNATIRDRYIGAASATPARVFPILLRGAQDHLSAARKKGKGGWAYVLEEEIRDIMDGLDAAKPFPASLDLDRQGRFFVGYYHAKTAEPLKKHTAEHESDSAESEE
ncbi:MAG: type I-C CRISPR-associated protein Cas8c/Csd1, partial [Hyphomicrobiales bacterium]|nr:type I-C CRISPR-associated protein Cas8c/Csd1 [Hyphomicrobiales bacterium]